MFVFSVNYLRQQKTTPPSPSLLPSIDSYSYHILNSTNSIIDPLPSIIMPSEIVECKHCGASVSNAQAECPNCGKAPH